MRARVGALAAIAALTATAAAGAQVVLPPPDTLLGGGNLGFKYGPNGGHADLGFVTVRVGKNGKSVHFYGDLNSICKGFKGAVTANFDGLAPIDPAGAFAGLGKVAKQAHSKGMHYEFSGAFTGAGAVKGTARVRFTFLTGNASYPCSSGTFAWEARADVKNAAGPPKPVAGALYGGNNGQTYPVILRVAKNGRKVAQLATETDVKCKGRKDSIFYSVVAPPSRIGSDGSFVATEKWVANAFYFGADVKAAASQVVKGTFGRTTVAGTWRVDFALTSRKTGKKTGTCSTGVVRWSASL